MDINEFAKIISGGAIFLALLHIFVPNLGIDATLISLLIIAALPYIIPFIKSVELPGGFKIELKDVKAATDKIISLKGEAKVKTSTSEPMLDVEDSFSTLRHIAEIDPNLSLVGFRIELEKRLLKIAEQNKIDTYRKPLQYIVTSLIGRQLLPGSVASGLSELIAMGNRAAHGVNVSPDAAEWVLDVGPSILNTLDSLIKFS